MDEQAVDAGGVGPVRCFFATHGFMENGEVMPPCEGRLIRAHLIDKQELVRLGLDPFAHGTWVYACGGHNYGNEGHHGMFDHYRLQVPFHKVPTSTRQFAARHKLLGRLRRYK